MALSGDHILSFSGKVNPRPVHVPAWVDESGDDTVFVRSMTLAELTVSQSRAQRNAMAEDDRPDDTSLAFVLARCIVNEDGSRMFKDAQVGAIKELPAPQAFKIYAAIQEESGETDESEKAIEGNSDAAPSGASSSTSPDPSSTAPSTSLRSA